MQLTFKGRTALITGAAQGIGRAIATALHEAGATLHLADLDREGLQTCAEDLGATAHVADLSDQDAAKHIADNVADQAGGIDILVLAAGGVRGQVGRSIEDVTEADWHTLFKANVDGAFFLTQATAPYMKHRRYGRIVTISSGAGLRPSLTGIQAYAAAKHALVGLTRQLSWELGPHGITVNSIAPGFVLSNPTTQKQWESYGADGQARLIESIHTKRLGTAEDIANAALFFASEQAGWITGQVLSVDGGRS